MFASVHCCTGDLALEVLILTFFGDLLPTASLYLGTRTMAVKETIRINPAGESAVSKSILAELQPLSSGVRRSPFTVRRARKPWRIVSLCLFRTERKPRRFAYPRLVNGERRTPSVPPLIAKSIVLYFVVSLRIRSIQLLQVDSDLDLSPRIGWGVCDHSPGLCRLHHLADRLGSICAALVRRLFVRLQC